MKYLQMAVDWLRALTGLAVGVLALAVVLQVLFGPNVAFFPINVVGNVIAITKALGSEGLVGLVATWVLLSMFNNKSSGESTST